MRQRSINRWSNCDCQLFSLSINLLVYEIRESGEKIYHCLLRLRRHLQIITSQKTKVNEFERKQRKADDSHFYELGY